MQVVVNSDPLEDEVSSVLLHFTEWLNAFGETSLDHQTFFAGPFGRSAKALYYRRPKLGIVAVAPMILTPRSNAC